MSATAGTFRLPRASKSSWEAWNGVIPIGVPVYESDTGLIKVGDGVTHYKLLPYAGVGMAEATANGLYVKFTPGRPGNFTIEGTPTFGQVPVAQDATHAAWGREPLIVASKSADYELTINDQGTAIAFTGSGARKLKVPEGVFPNSAQPVEIRKMGSGSVEVVGLGSMTILHASTNPNLRAQYSVAGLAFVSATQALLSGDIE